YEGATHASSAGPPPSIRMLLASGTVIRAAGSRRTAFQIGSSDCRLTSISGAATASATFCSAGRLVIIGGGWNGLDAKSLMRTRTFPFLSRRWKLTLRTFWLLLESSAQVA